MDNGSPASLPASAQTTTAIHGIPITSVWRATKSIAAKARREPRRRVAAARAARATTRRRAGRRAAPVSTASSVYVDSPASTFTCVRTAVTPALPSPNPHGWWSTVRSPARRLARCSLVDDSFALVASWDVCGWRLRVVPPGCAARVGVKCARARSASYALTNANPSAATSDGEHDRRTPRAAAPRGRAARRRARAAPRACASRAAPRRAAARAAAPQRRPRSGTKSSATTSR